MSAAPLSNRGRWTTKNRSPEDSEFCKRCRRDPSAMQNLLLTPSSCHLATGSEAPKIIGIWRWRMRKFRITKQFLRLMRLAELKAVWQRHRNRRVSVSRTRGTSFNNSGTHHRYRGQLFIIKKFQNKEAFPSSELYPLRAAFNQILRRRAWILTISLDIPFSENALVFHEFC